MKRIPDKKRWQIFNYWMKNPDTKNAALAKKYDLTPATITLILTEQLQKCKQK